MTETKKSYFAVIPANVRYDKRLKLLSRMLYGEITALCNEKGYCWANNRYFADLYEVSITTISTCISQLKEFGYIEVEIVYKEGSKEILNRYLKIIKDPIKEILNTPIKENLKDNNTIINNTINNINNNSAEAPKKLKSNNQLFATETKPKKAKENKYVEIINDLSSNEQIKNALLDYCNFRRTRGLTAQQWRAMLVKFKNDSKEKSVDEILKCIEQCLINGRNSLYYSQSLNQNKKNAPPAAVDDSGPSVIRRRKD